MSEERPVPRRESPWGLPEGDKRQPKAHRCNGFHPSYSVLTFSSYCYSVLAYFSNSCYSVLASSPEQANRLDVVQACFEGNPFKTVPGPFKLFWQCMRSNPGEEPTEPYTYLQLDPPKRAEAKLE